MRTITLELLRHGPSHNQLVSPLTPYLALCENHSAVTVHLPFEHNQVLRRLSALEYQESPESRHFQLRDTARVMGDILDQVPGLKAAVNHQSGGLTHLRLIISASELALLPFELALSPNGCPGAGQHLLLQTQSPVCLTREVRRATNEMLPPPDKFRILFAAASPDGVGSVPLQSHLLALRKAVSPWIQYYDPKDDRERRQRVAEHLVVLPNASIEAIREACADGGFTHVHILAHGVKHQIGDDWSFCLALHDARDLSQVDYVDGPRLASALTASRDPAPPLQGYGAKDRTSTQPHLVSLASCNSGSIGSVAGAGASIAHALHESGIPMVVAGQFPLSFKGSVQLVETLYQGLLWAEDPRQLLQKLRCDMHSDFSDTHDWASLTAYASLPPEFHRHLCDLRIRRTVMSIDAAMNVADESIRLHAGLDPKAREASLASACVRIEEATKALSALLYQLPIDGARISGLLGSTKKRQAEILYLMADHCDSTVVERLQQARDHYRDAFRRNRSSGWALVQHLSLTRVLACLKGSDAAALVDEAEAAKLMAAAQLLSKEDIYASDSSAEQRLWSYGNLVELELLTLFTEEGRGQAQEVRDRAMMYAGELLNITNTGVSAFEAYTTLRQLRRYTGWYHAIATLPPEVHALAQTILQLFPASLGTRWP
ncbi:CHAT domain-containing protein [Azospirillum sp.]|uniref:CHAT domain-containing protein n=1 Tax=Azospirillum sp. TaxID=34012 RepID=UPI002D4E2580|nr:CHAT domain-containing protein [Azospirillum sp.]HYF86448.1 CHAT domain-containing protein [Azospirillum sp.]